MGAAISRIGTGVTGEWPPTGRDPWRRPFRAMARGSASGEVPQSRLALARGRGVRPRDSPTPLFAHCRRFGGHQTTTIARAGHQAVRPTAGTGRRRGAGWVRTPPDVRNPPGGVGSGRRPGLHPESATAGERPVGGTADQQPTRQQDQRFPSVDRARADQDGPEQQPHAPRLGTQVTAVEGFEHVLGLTLRPTVRTGRRTWWGPVRPHRPGPTPPRAGCRPSPPGNGRCPPRRSRTPSRTGPAGRARRRSGGTTAGPGGCRSRRDRR